jgi:hypothetical protein
MLSKTLVDGLTELKNRKSAVLKLCQISPTPLSSDVKASEAQRAPGQLLIFVEVAAVSTKSCSYNFPPLPDSSTTNSKLTTSDTSSQ